MNIKSYTSFRFSRLIIGLAFLAAFSSCNAIQTLTGEETDPGKFWEKTHNNSAPQSYYVFFNSGAPHFLNTYDGFVGSLPAGSDGSSFTPFDGHLFYSASGGSYYELYRYDTSNGTAAKVTSYQNSSKMPLEEFNGSLYFTQDPTGELCSVSSSTDTPVCDSASYGEFHYTHWFVNNHKDGKLYACIGMSNPGQLMEVDVSGGLPSLVTPDGFTDMPCSHDRPIFYEGKFVYVSSTQASIFDSATYARVDLALNVANFAGLSMQGNVYISDNGDLHTLSLSDNTLTLRAAAANPTSNIIEGPDAIYSIAYDGGSSAYRIFRMPKWDSSQIEIITNFSSVDAGTHLAVGPDGFFVFTPTGIESVPFDGTPPNNIYSGTVNSYFELLHSF